MSPRIIDSFSIDAPHALFSVGLIFLAAGVLVVMALWDHLKDHVPPPPPLPGDDLPPPFFPPF